jgi:hypothetical protein
MGREKDLVAETLTRQEAIRRGVMTFDSVGEALEKVAPVNSRKMYGFTRKLVPQDLPTEPKVYIYSIHEVGEQVNLGPGFPAFEVKACPPGLDYGEPCIILPVNFFEEAKVDVTEHTFTSGKQLVDAIMKWGPGMAASMDRRKVGWFVSDTFPPKPEEVEEAKKLYTEACLNLIRQGNRAFAENKLNEINEDNYRAQRWTKQPVQWTKAVKQMMDCPGCGEPVPQGTAKHTAPYCGAVIDWLAAIKLGMAKVEDAPQEIQDEWTKPRKGRS